MLFSKGQAIPLMINKKYVPTEIVYITYTIDRKKKYMIRKNIKMKLTQKMHNKDTSRIITPWNSMIQSKCYFLYRMY